MKIKRLISWVAGTTFGFLALAGPASAATGCQTFIQVIQATITSSGGLVVTVNHATAGGLISGVGTVSLADSGLMTIRTLHPTGSGSIALLAATTNTDVAVNNPCETISRTSGTFVIDMASTSGAFAGATETGSYSALAVIIRDQVAGRCAVSGHLHLSLQATGIIQTP